MLGTRPAVTPDDPLAKKEKITAKDLTGRTILVNGVSSAAKLRKVQQDLLAQVKLKTLNSPNHDFTMVQVAAKQVNCLSPGYLNDFTNQLVWVPYDTEECFNCVLVTHQTDNRQSLEDFVLLLQDIYQDNAKTYQV